MKKIISMLLVAFVLVGCSSNSTTNTVSKEPTETVSVFNGSYIDLLGDKRDEIYNLGLDLSDNEVKVLGTELPTKTFTSYEGETVALPDGPYVFEILGSWCTYCQALVNETHELYASLGLPVYQYFLDGVAEDVDSFYDAIGIERVATATQLVSNSEMETWANENEFYSVPMIIVVDDSGKIAMTHIGYLPAEDFSAYIEYALDAKLYDVEIEGTSLSEYLTRQDAIREYIDNLTEIEVPTSIFNKKEESPVTEVESGPVVEETVENQTESDEPVEADDTTEGDEIVETPVEEEAE